MNPASLKLVAIGILAILSFDALTAYLMKRYRVNIFLPSIISALIYIVLGNLLAKYNGLISVAAISGLIGLIDATIGLRLVFSINPKIEELIKTQFNTESIGLVIFMICLAAGLGIIGALF